MSIGNLCLVTAVEHEYKIVASLLTGSTISTENEIGICRGGFGESRIAVLKSGMGAKGFAGRLANHLRLNDYHAVVVAGFAGGLNPSLKSGDTVIYNLCYEESNDRGSSIACDTNLTKSIVDHLRKTKPKSIQGAGVTVSRLVTAASEKIALGFKYNALAADMESYPVIAVCTEAHVPAAVLRIISDGADADLPDFNSAIDSDGRINNWKMAATVLRTPLSSMRFFRNLSPALSSFKECMKELLNA